MSDHFNLDDYTFDDEPILRGAKDSKQRMKHESRFMCMQESWANKAFEISRKCQSPGPIIIGMILWQKFWLGKCKQPLKISNQRLGLFGLKRRYFTKWIAPLEKAGLVRTEKFKHRSSLITIVAR